MATRDVIVGGLEGLDRFDAVSREIEERFSHFHSLLETQRAVLLQRVKKMRELYQKHRDLDKAIQQLEGIRKATNEMLTENLVAGKKEETVNYWDENIRDLKENKSNLENVSNLRFVCDNEEFSNSVKRIHLREIEAVEYGKRREPLVMKVNRGIDEGGVIDPRCVSIDDVTNEVFVADWFKVIISIYSSEGDFIKSFGNEQLSRPYGICVSGEFVFVADRGNNSVLKFVKTGEFVKRTSSQGETVQLKSPTGLCVYRECVYVCDYSNNSVVVLNLDLSSMKRFGKEKLKHPEDIITFHDQIFVLTLVDNRIHTFNSELNFLRSISLTGQTQKIRYAFFFTIDNKSNFIVSDTFGNCLKVFNSSGEYTESLGDGFLHLPQGIAIDNQQRIVVICECETSYFQVY